MCQSCAVISAIDIAVGNSCYLLLLLLLRYDLMNNSTHLHFALAAYTNCEFNEKLDTGVHRH
jgi:hypothetical protein